MSEEDCECNRLNLHAIKKWKNIHKKYTHTHTYIWGYYFIYKIALPNQEKGLNI